MPKRRRSDVSSAESVFEAVNAGPRLMWTVKLRGRDETEWDWQQRRPPPLRLLVPVRRPHSSRNNRHIPAAAYSMINGGLVELESGLEHDLVRSIDRDRRIQLIIAQPFTLSWKRSRHTPDLLTVTEGGAVTVWDVRAIERQDDDFRAKSEITRQECRAVGWAYRVFEGLDRIERLNLLWLHCCRQRPAWADAHEERICALVGAGVTLGHLFAHDDGSGELKSTVWHLLWRGELEIDMYSPWDLTTQVTVKRGNEDA
ncbi:hypothetical protein MycrhN_2729 [Mycolicibacterium rhodesiae NBB3]|uniref:TnsA-like heteromeric transposase endonuclease subunit n=1 Tax=Mycolicibacterium rhodesiae (strain NBB3) TaxID=710685 RepID=G8RH06_MYCRN|nr:TnsA-like heteromeric transposase endonuclease subunit [Mycolicibacterium rhodesiae]AEV73310.1 hypothetical protein MycrhN_2729 [Mycolicibacterium rhodesiae NBB3]